MRIVLACGRILIATLTLRVALVVVGVPTPLIAQEMIGKRQFPDQLVISEPFVEDELSLPAFLHIDRVRIGGQRSRLTSAGGEVKKRITSDLELSLTGNLIYLDRTDGDSISGFDNLVVGLKYQLFASELHEAVASVALSWEVGGTGRRAVGAELSDTVTPTVLAGKGLGDLPDELAVLKPLALAALLGVQIPDGRRPHVLVWGGVVEYSLPYLDSFVKRVDLPRPLNQLIPLVEVEIRTNLDRGDAGRLRGTVNPGVVWIGKQLQIGLEAVAPLDDRSGRGVGARGFLRIPLEALFGKRAGQPLFGGR